MRYPSAIQRPGGCHEGTARRRRHPCRARHGRHCHSLRQIACSLLYRRLRGDDDTVAIAAITAAELLVGAHFATRRHRACRQQYVNAVLASVPVLGYDLRVAEAHDGLLAETRRAGRPRGARDLIIAATALSSGRMVVTSDPAGFEGLGGVEVASHR